MSLQTRSKLVLRIKAAVTHHLLVMLAGFLITAVCAAAVRHDLCQVAQGAVHAPAYACRRGVHVMLLNV